MSGDLIGSRISLISRKDIRWEGILVQVDRENASVTLQSVKSWGTEGRAEGIMQIPPAEQLHEMVMFRGEDIKDLHVHETAEPTPVAPMPSSVGMAPPPAHMMNTAVASKPSIEMPPPQIAITTPSTGASATVAAAAAPISVSSSASAPVVAARPNPVPPPPARLSAFVAPDAAAGGGGGDGGLSSVATVTEPGEATSNNGETKAGEGSPPQTMRDQGQKPGRYQPPHRNPHWKPPQSNPRPASGSGASALPGQGNHLLNRRTRGSGSGPLNEDGEFDFEAGLAKFDKEKEMALLAGSMSATSIQSHGDSSMTSEGFINGEEIEEQEAAAGDMGAGGVAAAAAAAAAAASAGERRTAADGGEIWVEPAVVVKKYNKSSFFDEISCDALDGRGRMPGGYGRERTRNTETFGATSVALSSASRRYGGRGGGGYSSYSGGGARRGGYGYGDNGYRGRPYNGDRGAGGSGGGSGGAGVSGDRQDSSGSWRRN